MDMFKYISEIRKTLITEYGFQERSDVPGIPINVPDGDYPMKIGGKLDRVKIIDGKIYCCRFDGE
jgi:hypothetical protein